MVEEILKSIEEAKRTADLSEKHFSRYGEFLASFELSKYGWDNYTPVYDEYTDLLIHKVVCKDCKKPWNTNPKLRCDNCKREITSSNKKDIVANGKCNNCKKIFLKKSLSKCPHCKSQDVDSIPTCPFCKKGRVKIDENACPHCGSKNHSEKFRTVQVKASRIEARGNSYAVDLRPRDLAQGDFHCYIWVCIDEEDKAHFLVIPLKDFGKESKNFLNSTSFVKDQGREHFNAKTFGKWSKYLNKFNLLE